MHTQSIQYNLAALTGIVNQISPDFLCVELPRRDWESRQFNDFAPTAGWRAGVARWLAQALRRAQRTANNAEAIHNWLFEGVCHTLCALNEMSWDAEARRAWNAQNQAMLDNILQAARRDPGRRMLVAAQCQRIHWLEPRLRQVPDIELVDYRAL
jgi:hypothetical protein